MTYSLCIKSKHILFCFFVFFSLQVGTKYSETLEWNKNEIENRSFYFV